MDVFNTTISTSSVNELRSMMVSIQRQLNKVLETTDNTFDKYVSLHKEFVSHSLAEELENELYSATGLPHNQKSPKVTWFGDTPYKYTGHREHPTNPIVPNSALHKALCKINSELSLDLDGCLVSIYNSSECHLNAHADDESSMDSTSPICNLSIGAERTSLLSLNGRKATYNTRQSIPVKHPMHLPTRSLQIMHPGCQENLLHEIPPGTGEEQQGTRISLSFRKCIHKPKLSPPSVASSSPISAPSPSTATLTHQPTTKTTLIIGTSITRPLESEKLGKKGNKCINISQGGAKISHIKDNLLKYKSGNNTRIDKIIMSLGTNDIRNIRDTSNLEEPLKDLLETTKNNYPHAELYIQSMLPIKLNSWWCEDNKNVVDNCYSFNRLLFKMCKKYNLYYIDMFKDFLSLGKPGERDVRMDLYGQDKVHLSRKGVAVLARRFIYIINKDTLEFRPTKF